LIVDNSYTFFTSNDSNIKKYSFLILSFGIIGIIGTEVEELVSRYAFNQGSHQFFNLGGKHLFNSILSVIIGFITFNAIRLKKGTKAQTEISKEGQIPEPELNSKKPLTAIPIRQGDTFLLYPLEKIIFFEAYDNYSFLFDLEGKKHLCNYSLLFLEKKLENEFLRVHRKYLIHKNQIVQITPHIKGRYTIEFKDSNKTTITSSTSYAEKIKSLIKL